MLTLQNMILLYLTVINFTGFAFMGIDKQKARKHLWRIPEKTLFLIAVLGGSAGTIAGMYAFHHKTRHWYFVIGMPLIFFLHTGSAVYFFLIAPRL